MSSFINEWETYLDLDARYNVSSSGGRVASITDRSSNGFVFAQPNASLQPPTPRVDGEGLYGLPVGYAELNGPDLALYGEFHSFAVINIRTLPLANYSNYFVYPMPVPTTPRVIFLYVNNTASIIVNSYNGLGGANLPFSTQRPMVIAWGWRAGTSYLKILGRDSGSISTSTFAVAEITTAPSPAVSRINAPRNTGQDYTLSRLAIIYQDMALSDVDDAMKSLYIHIKTPREPKTINAFSKNIINTNTFN